MGDRSVLSRAGDVYVGILIGALATALVLHLAGLF